MIPTQVGPILGPLIGGALAHAFGWRSCFIALAIFAVLALFAKLLVLREVSP
jgi:MFS family permease